MKLQTKNNADQQDQTSNAGPSSDTKNTVKVKTGLKAGGKWVPNHSQAAVKVKTGLKAGGKWVPNHSRLAVKVKTAGR